MAGSLSVQLTDETRRTLESVVRLTLPAENWPRVALMLRQIDEALKAGDSEGLRARLRALREIADSADAGQQETVAAPDVARYRPPIRWTVAALVGAGVLFGGVIVPVALRHFGDSGGAPVPTTTAPPAPTTVPTMPSTGSGGAGMAVVAAVLVVAAVAVFFVMIRRARSRAATAAGRESVVSGESGAAAPLGFPAPRQLIEYADRTVRSLPAPGGAHRNH